MIEAECAKLSDETGTEIVAHPFENLLIDCAHDVGAQIIVRGLRAVADFEYEFQMVGMNRALDSSVETVFLMAEARHQAIASKLVKEIARLDGDVSKFVSTAGQGQAAAPTGQVRLTPARELIGHRQSRADARLCAFGGALRAGRRQLAPPESFKARGQEPAEAAAR